VASDEAARIRAQEIVMVKFAVAVGVALDGSKVGLVEGLLADGEVEMV
jgi:hypothetical protein